MANLRRRRFIFEVLFVALGLGIFALGNWFFRTFMTNFDERDHIAVGYLMSKGLILYKDIFSHHFPLPYYWVNFLDFLWVNQVPSRGIAMFRTTLNLFYLLCSCLVLVNIKTLKNKLYFLLFLISTIPLMPLFHGNVLLSETFGFFPVILLIWLVFSGFNGDLKENKLLAICSSILAAFAFWTQPLLIAAYLLPLFYFKKERLFYLIFSFLTVLIPLLLFFINGSLSAFWEMGIWFNGVIYPKYGVYTNVDGTVSGVFGTIINQTKMLFPRNFTSDIANMQFVGSWAIVGLGVILLAKKRFKLFLAFVLSFAVVRIREVKIIPGELFNFGVLPYMWFVNLVFIALVMKLRKASEYFAVFVFILYLGFSLKANEPIIKQSLLSGYNYHVFWSDRQVIGEEIAKLASPNDSILVYPHDVDLYYFAKRTPPDKFIYWFPWINDVEKYRKERARSIDEKKAKVLYVGTGTYRVDPNYYENLWPNLTECYKQATNEGKFSNIWVRL